jgi:thiamine biosynthesis protein ThiI
MGDLVFMVLLSSLPQTFLNPNHNPTAMSLFLVRYGELGLKSSRVRRRFENTLVRNIEDAFLRDGVQCLTNMDWGRIYIHADRDDMAQEILNKIFGITSFSKAVECSSSLEDICSTASDYSMSMLTDNSSFAVRAKRTGEHPFTSQEVASSVGSAILERNEDKNVKVNLTKPDHVIYVEVRHNRAFIFSKKIKGPGGFPMGTQGKVLTQITDKKSILAAWLMLKRGCTVRLLCQDEVALRYAKVLKKWYIPSRPFTTEGKEEKEILSTAIKIKAEALVFGYTYKELEDLGMFKTELPVFYPLVGMNEKEIDEKITSLFGDDF